MSKCEKVILLAILLLGGIVKFLNIKPPETSYPYFRGGSSHDFRPRAQSIERSGPNIYIFKKKDKRE